MDLNDLDDVNVGDPVNPDPALLRFNGTEWVGNTVLEDGDTWVSNDTTFATTAAGDTRWLNATGGDVVGGDMITVTEAAGEVIIDVDLAGTSGLESTNPGNAAGELRINTNDGCEIVAAGLNAETTDASIVQTGGDNNDPAIRVQTTLGAAVTNNDLTITGGNDITVTRNSDTELTIASSAVGDTYDLNATDDGDNVDLNLTSGSGTDNSTVQLTAGAGINIDHTSNSEITFSTTSTTALWENDSGTIQTADADRNVRVRDTNGAVHQLNFDGSAVFNEQGDSANFRVESNSDANMLFVSGANDRVGIGTGSPNETLEVDGNARIVGDVIIRTGNDLTFNNAANDQSVSINADDATATYNLTLPPAGPTADNRFLRAAGTGTGANQELEWVAAGGGGASVSVGTNPPEAASAANAGDLWFNDDTGRLFISYTDATPDSQWIDAAPAAEADQNLQQVTNNGNSTDDVIIVSANGDPANGANAGTRLGPGGTVVATHSSATGNLFEGFTSGSSTRTITMIANGNAEFAGNITTNGNLVIGTAGQGIDFSAQSTTTAAGTSTTGELLDHYEEGTWTPTVTGTSGAAFTVGSVNCAYIRVGSLVNVVASFTVQMTAGANVFAQISGLPYVRRANTPFTAFPMANAGGTSWGRQNSEQCFLAGNSALASANTGLQVSLADTAFWPAGVNVTVQFSMTYITT